MSGSDPTYSRVSSRFWPEAKEGEWTDDMVTLGLYLLTCEQRTTEGLCRLPKGYMIEDLPDGWTTERLTASLDALSAEGFAHYDDKARVVFLPKAMKYQRPDNKNQQTAAIRNLKGLPATRFSEAFVEAAKQYAQAFHQALLQAFPQGLGKGYRDSLALALTPTTALTPNSVDPVHNSAKPERGCSIEHEEHEPEPPGDSGGDGAAASHTATTDNVGALRHSPTCEDRECAVRTLRCGLRGTIAQIVGPAEAGNLYNESTALHKSLAGMAGYICAATWKASSAATMEERQPLCRKAIVAYVDTLYDFHRQKPIRSLPAFLKTRYCHMTEAPVSDELLAALRKLERTGTNGKSEPVRVGTTLPPIELVEEEAS